MTTAARVSAKNLTHSKALPRWKWSGDDEPIEYRRCDEDEDTVTLTADEKRNLKWYNAQAHREWRDADADETPVQHVPFCVNLTKEERDKKSKQFKHGLCSDCDAGLNNESDFVCQPRPNGAVAMMCNACHQLYQRLTCVRGVDCGLGRN